jgi:pyrroloquinoline quinone biosynthesis protein D
MDSVHHGPTNRTDVSGSDRLRLARHVRLVFSLARQRHVLQLPETVVVLNGSGAHIVELCDGRHTVAEILAELAVCYDTVRDDEVRRFLTRLVARHCLERADG